MAKFLLNESVTTEFSINKNTTAFLIDFTLPDHIRENLPVEQIRAVDGIFTMSLYSESMMVNDIIEYRGFRWKVIQRVFVANRYRKRSEPRQIPRLIVEYLGMVPSEGNDMEATRDDMEA